MTASTHVFRQGDTVHFAVETELTAAGVAWTFQYTAGGTLSLPACSGQLTCAAAPSGSGRMEVQLLESVTRLWVTTRSAPVQITSTTESLIVTCGPPSNTAGGPVIRGQAVKCSAKTSSGKAFTVKYAAVIGDDVASDGSVDVTGTAVNKGKGWETDVGPAVFSGNLLINAELQQGQQVQPLLGSGRLAVNPRPAPFFQPRFAGGAPTTDSIGGLFEPPIIFIPFVDQLFDFTLGALFPIRVDTAGLAGLSTLPVTTGPFKELKVALLAAVTTLPLREPRVIVHPLFSKDTTIEIYADQDGTDDGIRVEDETGRAFCDNSVSTDWADRLREFVRRHEGVGGVSDSHYGIYTSQFAALSRFDPLEKLAVPQGSTNDDLKRLVLDAFRAWNRLPEVTAPHDAIDDRDGNPAAQNAAAGCAIDFDFSREYKGRPK